MHVDLLTCSRKFYSYETYAATHLAHAFQEIGMATAIFSLDDGGLSEYLSQAAANPPKWTVAFKPLLKLTQPLCDILGIPHLHWERRSLSYSAHLMGSRFGKMALTDRKAAAHYSLTFLPHATHLNVGKLCAGRPYDVVLFADLVDEACKLSLWKELFPPEGVSLLIEGAKRCLQDPNTLPFHVAHLLHRASPEALAFHDVAFFLEDYVRAVRMRTLIESFEGVQVHIFGDHIGNNWLRRLKNKDWISLHSTLPYTEHFEVLKMAKILVRSHDKGFDGSDEWVLPAIEAGCLPLIPPIPYFEERLGNERRLFYEDNLSDQITYFLAHPAERAALVSQLKEVLIPGNPFEERAKQIYAVMEKT